MVKENIFLKMVLFMKGIFIKDNFMVMEKCYFQMEVLWLENGKMENYKKKNIIILMSYYIEKKINFIVLIMIVDLKLRQEKELNLLVKHFFIIQKIKFNKFLKEHMMLKTVFLIQEEI